MTIDYLHMICSLLTSNLLYYKIPYFIYVTMVPWRSYDNALTLLSIFNTCIISSSLPYSILFVVTLGLIGLCAIAVVLTSSILLAFSSYDICPYATSLYTVSASLGLIWTISTYLCDSHSTRLHVTRDLDYLHFNALEFILGHIASLVTLISVCLYRP